MLNSIMRAATPKNAEEEWYGGQRSNLKNGFPPDLLGFPIDAVAVLRICTRKGGTDGRREGRNFVVGALS